MSFRKKVLRPTPINRQLEIEPSTKSKSINQVRTYAIIKEIVSITTNRNNNNVSKTQNSKLSWNTSPPSALARVYVSAVHVFLCFFSFRLWCIICSPVHHKSYAARSAASIGSLLLCGIHVDTRDTNYICMYSCIYNRIELYSRSKIYIEKTHRHWTHRSWIGLDRIGSR